MKSFHEQRKNSCVDKWYNKHFKTNNSSRSFFTNYPQKQFFFLLNRSKKMRYVRTKPCRRISSTTKSTMKAFFVGVFSRNSRNEWKGRVTNQKFNATKPKSRLKEFPRRTLKSHFIKTLNLPQIVAPWDLLYQHGQPYTNTPALEFFFTFSFKNFLFAALFQFRFKERPHYNDIQKLLSIRASIRSIRLEAENWLPLFHVTSLHHSFTSRELRS